MWSNRHPLRCHDIQQNKTQHINKNATLSKRTHNMGTRSIMTHSTTTLSIMTRSITILSILTLRITTYSIVTKIIILFSIMKHSKETLRIPTLRYNNKNHNSIQHNDT